MLTVGSECHHTMILISEVMCIIGKEKRRNCLIAGAPHRTPLVGAYSAPPDPLIGGEGRKPLPRIPSPPWLGLWSLNIFSGSTNGNSASTQTCVHAAGFILTLYVGQVRRSRSQVKVHGRRMKSCLSSSLHQGGRGRFVRPRVILDLESDWGTGQGH